MNNSSRIATLLFLHSRNEITPEEEKELLNWRRQSPDNEETFKDYSDPASVQKMMADYYRERDSVYNNLKLILPDLANSNLSDSTGYLKDPATETFSEDERMSFPEKQLAASGLTKSAFWESMLGDTGVEKHLRQTGDDGKLTDLKRVGEKSTAPRTPIRFLKKLLRVAAAVVLTGALIYGVHEFSGKSNNRFIASFATSDGATDKYLDDAERGFYAGKSDIDIKENSKGEQIWIFSNQPDKSKDYFNTLKTKNGNEFILRLPDGTQIWMNAESSIHFPANFSQDTIHLVITGEVYIEIADTNPHAYIIRSTVNGQRSTPGEMQLHTKAGRFNLSAYDNDPVTRVNMVKGEASVQIEDDKTTQPVIIQAGQQAALTNGHLTVNSVADNNEILALKNGEIYFKSATLQTILQTVSRWYDVNVNDLLPNDKKFTLKVPLGSDISVIIDSLRQQGAHIVLSGKTITVMK